MRDSACLCVFVGGGCCNGRDTRRSPTRIFVSVLLCLIQQESLFNCRHTSFEFPSTPPHMDGVICQQFTVFWVRDAIISLSFILDPYRHSIRVHLKTDDPCEGRLNKQSRSCQHSVSTAAQQQQQQQQMTELVTQARSVCLRTWKTSLAYAMRETLLHSSWSY
ncbi:hypothetical protein CC78DRAFT_64014 [Lojkania enalia]|uniref:Uncharacterized protein n=1 Tax=Lojkania enalia TaxID=147567 RepID=A0A9P4KEC9_9PLEO|nr:hypothetical protein CC78DRAFT_64014 [Didymosphaeria enalia]